VRVESNCLANDPNSLFRLRLQIKSNTIAANRSHMFWINNLSANKYCRKLNIWNTIVYNLNIPSPLSLLYSWLLHWYWSLDLEICSTFIYIWNKCPHKSKYWGDSYKNVSALRGRQGRSYSWGRVGTRLLCFDRLQADEADIFTIPTSWTKKNVCWRQSSK